MLVNIMLVSIAHAQDFIVHVPDQLISDGASWEHFSEVDRDERASLFVEKVLLAPQYKWVRDFVITYYTWGKIRDWDQAGITVEVHR